MWEGSVTFVSPIFDLFALSTTLQLINTEFHHIHQQQTHLRSTTWLSLTEMFTYKHLFRQKI